MNNPLFEMQTSTPLTTSTFPRGIHNAEDVIAWWSRVQLETEGISLGQAEAIQKACEELREARLETIMTERPEIRLLQAILELAPYVNTEQLVVSLQNRGDLFREFRIVLPKQSPLTVASTQLHLGSEPKKPFDYKDYDPTGNFELGFFTDKSIVDWWKQIGMPLVGVPATFFQELGKLQLACQDWVYKTAQGSDDQRTHSSMIQARIRVENFVAKATKNKTLPEFFKPKGIAAAEVSETEVEPPKERSFFVPAYASPEDLNVAEFWELANTKGYEQSSQIPILPGFVSIKTLTFYERLEGSWGVQSDENFNEFHRAYLPFIAKAMIEENKIVALANQATMIAMHNSSDGSVDLNKLLKEALKLPLYLGLNYDSFVELSKKAE